VAESVVGWLRDFATCYLHDPASLSIQLPFASRTAVYEVYVSESQDADFAQLFVLEEGGPPVVASKKYFYHVWAKDERLRHITVRKYLRFSLCEKCVEYIRRRQHIFGDDERKRIRADELSHYKEVREERESYYRRRLLAQREPARYMSVIIDGADQAAYGLPHYRLKNKTLDGALKIPLHLMGCIAHGRDVYGFTYLPNFKAGNNLTIEVLHRVLEAEMGIRGSLPRTLYVQLDNTSKQCKGKFVLGYLALLVEWEVVEEVLLSFLMVGHTHEDIGTVQLRANKITQSQSNTPPPPGP
jgi:hypothetical protein